MKTTTPNPLAVKFRDKMHAWILLALISAWIQHLPALAQPTFTSGTSLGTYYPPNNEISGIAASRTSPGVLWSQADSGDEARFYSLNTSASRLGIFNLIGATHTDWEDIAVGPGPISGLDYIYIGDIGDNGFNRTNVQVYRIPEPALYSRQSASPVTVNIPSSTWERITLVYPGLIFFREVDAETLMIDPRNGDLYIGGKEPDQCRLFRASAASLVNGATINLTEVAGIPTGWKATGGDIQPQGTESIIRGYNANRLLWKILPGQSIADAVAGQSYSIPYQNEGQGEAVCYERNGSGYMTMSEGSSERLWYFARTSADGPAPQFYLIAPDSTWKYLDNGSDQGSAWRASGFNDSGWNSGPAHFGYGETDERTAINYGGNPSQKYVTTYFRRKFCINTGADFDAIRLRAVYDSGIVVYINGTEVYRSALAGNAGSADLATDARMVTKYSWITVPLNESLLVAGENTVAAEVHLSNASQNAMSFDLQIEGVGQLSTVRPSVTLNGENPLTIQCGLPYTDPGAGAVNGCGAPVTVNAQSTVNPGVMGTYTVTYTAVDEMGNAAIPVTRTVFVNDTTPPEISACAPNQTIAANASCLAVVPDFTPGVIATDNCTPQGSIAYSQTPPVGMTVGAGDTTVTIRAMDSLGNSTTCQATLTASYQGPPAITITSQPQDLYLLENQSGSFQMAAEAGLGAILYQWQRYTGGSWSNLPGKTGDRLDLNSVQYEDRGDYRCAVINVICSTYIYMEPSETVTLFVAPPIVITEQPAGANLLPGEGHTLGITATVDAGALSYQWQFNSGLGFQNLSGAAAPTYIISNATLANAGSYRCIVKNTLAGFPVYSVISSSALVSVGTGDIYYVDPTATGADGLTWETAFHALQPAIDAARAAGGGEVWVAGGPVATPILYNEERSELWGGFEGSLVMKDNVSLYGGFEGYRNGTGIRETGRLQRNRARNIAVIDGSQARGGSAAYHVVVFGRSTAGTVNAVLDGFTIVGGNASGVGGAYHTWRGGGIYNYGSAPTIANCIITGNTAAVSGGGIANEISPNGGADALIANCLVYGNHADRQSDGGPGTVGNNGNPIRGGGGIFNNQSSPIMNYLTIVDNTANPFYVSDPLDHGADSAGIFTWNAVPTVSNSIVWDNIDGSIRHEHPAGPPQDIQVSYCDIQGGYAGVGNLNEDPQLGNPVYGALLGTVGVFVPLAVSPVINAGDPGVAPGEDILGVIRPVNAVVDMGAFEVSTNGPVAVCLDTQLDLALTQTVEDPFLVFDVAGSFLEAPIWLLELEDKTFGCGDMPGSTIEVTVTDILGRTSTCTADVAITESEDPVASCNDISVELDSTGNYALTSSDIAALSAGSVDNCTAYNDLDITVAPNVFTCAQAGRDVSALVTVTDGQGNSEFCVAQVTVNDTWPPVPPSLSNGISVSLSAEGMHTLTPAELQVLASGATDNCAVDLAATIATPSAFSCSDLGDNAISITLRDVNGNSSVSQATVTVTDITPPTITGTRDRLFASGGGDFTLAMALDGIAAHDTCDGDVTDDIVVEVFDADDNPVAFPIPDDWDLQGQLSYTFRMACSVQDWSGNDAVIEVSLTLYGLQLPVLTILGDNPVILECGTPYADAGATAFDPVTQEDITSSIQTVGSVNVHIPAAYSITYSVAVPGNPLLPPVTAIRTIVIEDTSPPTLTLHGTNPVYWPRNVAFVDPITASDTCDGDLTDMMVVNGFVDTASLGSYELTYDVSDTEGNSASTLELTVVVVNQIEFTRQPVGRRLYTTDPVHEMSASYHQGFLVAGYEWYRDDVGLGFIADDATPNTVTLNVNPAILDPGIYQYHLTVQDNTGETVSNNAEIEVALPMAASGLPDLTLIEGDEYDWEISVTGGLGQVTYQWMASLQSGKGFTPIVDGPYGTGNYGGSTTNTLNFAPFTEAMAGQYQVEVSDDFSSIIIGPATLTVGSGVPAINLLGLAVLSVASTITGILKSRRKQ